jgi:hypothetical protein
MEYSFSYFVNCDHFYTIKMPLIITPDKTEQNTTEILNLDA